MGLQRVYLSKILIVKVIFFKEINFTITILHKLKNFLKTQIRVKLKPSKKLGLEGVTFVQMDGCIIVQYFAEEKTFPSS